jgi:MATE family multidrug resistance protein
MTENTDHLAIGDSTLDIIKAITKIALPSFLTLLLTECIY